MSDRTLLNVLNMLRNETSLTFKASPIICSRRQFQILLLFFKKTTTTKQQQQKNKKQIRYDISRELSAGKMSQNLSSAAVVIGALRVNKFSNTRARMLDSICNMTLKLQFDVKTSRFCHLLCNVIKDAIM